MLEPVQLSTDPARFASLKVRLQQEQSGSCARDESKNDGTLTWVVPAGAGAGVEEAAEAWLQVDQFPRQIGKRIRQTHGRWFGRWHRRPPSDLCRKDLPARAEIRYGE